MKIHSKQIRQKSYFGAILGTFSSRYLFFLQKSIYVWQNFTVVFARIPIFKKNQMTMTGLRENAQTKGQEEIDF